MPYSVRTRAAVLARSFAVQGSWNYRTLQGSGFAFALLPALREKHGRASAALQDAVRRHTEIFNCNPYLAPMALGAVARLEDDGESPALIERFKAGVRGSLGTMGDRLVWAGWRPACLLLSLAIVLLGGPWWAAVVAFLVVYNAGHVWLRLWAFRIGIAEGKQLGQRLRASKVANAQRGLGGLGAFLLGLILPLAATGGMVHAAPGGLWVAAGVVGAAAGVHFGGRVRLVVSALLFLAALAGILTGIFA